MDLGSKRGIVGEKVWRKADQRRCVVDGQRFIADLTLVVAQIEEPVADDGAAERAAELLPPVVGLRDSQLFVNPVIRVGRGVENVVVAIAMCGIGSALGDGVGQAAARLAEFGLKSRARDLEFANYVFAELVRDAGAPDLLREERVVIIASVHRVIVEVSRNAIEADHAKVAIGGSSGG